MKTAESILLPLQALQRTHDELAHRDILSLDTHTKLKHMTLHFLKYGGKLAVARETEDMTLLRSTVLDSFIIVLATANALNINLGTHIDVRAQDLNALTRALSLRRPHDLFDFALTGLVKVAGRMAKSIESTDHLERGNPREELELLTVELAMKVLEISGALELDLAPAIRGRWRLVEQKSIFSRLDLD